MDKADNLFLLYPESIKNRKVLKGLLFDIFYQEKHKANTILMAYDSGIVEAIDREKKLGLTIRNQFIKILLSDYSIKKKNAEWAIDYWLEEYGRVYLHKELFNTENQSAVDKRNEGVPKSKRNADCAVNNCEAMDSNEGIKVKKFKNEEKIPKSLFTYHKSIEKKHGVSKLRCSIRKLYDVDLCTKFSITGEYEAETSKDLILVVRIYNDADDMIGVFYHLRIRKDDRGLVSFSDYLELPIDETISYIDLRVTPDPMP